MKFTEMKSPSAHNLVHLEFAEQPQMIILSYGIHLRNLIFNYLCFYENIKLQLR